jgi:hypothetical protein
LTKAGLAHIGAKVDLTLNAVSAKAYRVVIDVDTRLLLAAVAINGA